MGPGGRKKVYAALACAGALVTAAPASADELQAPQAADRDCTQAATGEPGVATETLTSPGVSMVSARLADAEGNWDLAIFQRSTADLVAASTYATGDEVAQGFAGPGELVVQACRLSGSDSAATVSTELRELTEPAPRMQIVRVATPTEEAEQALTTSGFDLTEHGGEGFVDVVLHSPAEGAMLAEKGFDFDVLDPDLEATTLAQRQADARMLERRAPWGVPSGRTGTYRRLFEYSNEMQAMAKDNKRLVRYFTLPHQTYEGRNVEAIEIAPRVKRRDGRPTFVLLGAHHAREWPSAEHAMEFAYELLNGWKKGNKRIRAMMRRSRVILIPVVNPDGFNTSREAGQLLLAGGGRGGIDETANLLIPFEYHRKNCRYLPPNEEDGGNCLQVPNLGLSQFGVDPNRNYGGFWGGPGASDSDTLPFGATAQDYRGPGPFSEPETQNIRHLLSRRPGITTISNHTFSNLLLRPPALQSAGRPADAGVLKRFGDAMAAKNGYASQPSYALYDTSGGMEDWSYYSTGGLGFTFEIGPDHFHPPFADTVAEYVGSTAAANGNGGNRAAYLLALRSTINKERHSVIRGTAPRRSFLTLSKRFRTPTSPVIDGATGEEGDVIFFKDRLRYQLPVRRSGRFAWHVNPSTRPLVDPRVAQPSDPVFFNGDATTTVPCADADSEDPTCWNDHPFRVPGGDGIDNGRATIKITWPTPASDWDMKVFRDSDRDGSSAGEGTPLGSSAQGPSTSEETTIAAPGLKRGKYVVRVTNFAGVEPYEGKVTFRKTLAPLISARRERWTLKCHARKNGPVLSRQKVYVKRGQVARVDLTRACR